MAIPRVFISSTCYDLSEVRDALVTFIRSFGFEDTLSEKGDVFYHPDLHTHESCIREITNCHLLILIIGGRFGGSYIADTSKSIVNAEYEAARELNIPVFTFVKNDVLHDHRLYEKNKNKKDNAKRIFEFINAVRKSPVNNGLFGFQFSRDIADLLKKQWAGMFYEFLLDRENKAKLESGNQTLSQLNSMSKKIEELVENIYRKVDDTGKADTVIETIDRKAEALSFFDAIEKALGSPLICLGDVGKIMRISLNHTWYEWLCGVPGILMASILTMDGRSTEVLYHSEKNRDIAHIRGDILDVNKKENEEYRTKFESFKALGKEDRKEILVASSNWGL